MEVAGALASVLFAAFSLPCLLLLVVVAEAFAWPSRSAFLGYRIARAGSFSSAATAVGGGVFQQEELLPPEYLDLLAVAVYRRGGDKWAAVDCVFCLSRIDDGEEVRELRCRHIFHRECLDSWLLCPRATCPLCRDRLLPCEPPRACARALDDDEIYVDEHEDPPSTSSSSYSHDAALWHM
ncbi:hypothetical protein CFC21_093804 [Triticum aestivum]|uniref:RING-type domain-containing protein n=2 Tax=Triticum aestivum TaxID=4565 RepID=A0A9R1LLR9_WHEAT|nr:hypothetical protein CFC21_093804 [Triticum aestivum]